MTSPTMSNPGHRGMMCLLIAAAMVPVLATLGCSRRDGPSRLLVPVSGTVKIDGKPLPDGEINFVTPSLGQLDILPVKSGSFAGKVGVGDRQVQIYSFVELPPDPTTGMPQPRTNTIPPRFSTESKLTAEVTEGGPNVFAFELK